MIEIFEYVKANWQGFLIAWVIFTGGLISIGESFRRD